MLTIPVLLATAIVLAILSAAIAAYEYWDRYPEKAQRQVGVVLQPVWRGIKLAYRVVRWPTTLLATWALLIFATPVYLFITLAWVLLKKVAGEPAKITVKFT